MPGNYKPTGRYKPGLTRLGIEPAMTYEQIADVMGCTAQYVEQVEKRALNKIRKQLGITH
jgi:DNA-directed RNA polymerase specialized sigma subunit